ncbi:hypothetical protein AZE42_03504 [Rhizopogon vesiculosus]|uniref:Uncharacterized protein n=1 Tax=Rhizopogon vesiculosus TaxID=180088 RepID=A0A1J8QGX5_9AGAM|nr:hypothetical protein AZE42_03504 [Rhizopogon vesiculosus]
MSICVRLPGTILYDRADIAADNIVRLYSPTAPMYIDVHFRYLRRHRSLDIEWFYSLGYKIQRHAPPGAGSASAIDKELAKAGPRGIHTRNGWQTLCWGHYDDSYGVQLRSWRCIEEGEVEISEKGTVDAYETLFGDMVRPAADDSQGIFAYRRSLVRGMRLLLAAVGISYEIACTDDERDKRPYAIVLEGLSDKWVARGIRSACGLRLERDAEEAREGAQEREEQAEGDGLDSDSYSEGGEEIFV